MQTGGVSFSFEIKLEFIGHKDAAYVQRKKGEGYNLHHSEAQWWRYYSFGCISSSGTGNLMKAEGLMKKEGYVKI